MRHVLLNLHVMLMLVTTIIAGSPCFAAGSLPVTWDESHAGLPLDLRKFDLVFAEEFHKEALDGPKLFAPVHSPFGAATFDRHWEEAYEVSGGLLTIRAYEKNRKWRSGSVQTADTRQSYHGARFGGKKGFACRGCYFEARLRFPPGTTDGFWGGFWLLSPDGPQGHVEIDVIEWYGGDPKGHHQSVHIWSKSGHAGQSNYTGMQILRDGQWHTYGSQVRDGHVFIYMDGREISRAAVPPAFDAYYYMLVSLTILPKQKEEAVSPMEMNVDYLRAYQPE